MRKYEGPFPILGRVGKVSYKVELPPRLKIHHVFHVNNLKPYHEDKEDPGRGISTRAPTAVVTSYDKEVDYIMADRVLRKNNFQPYKEYLVKWKGLLESEANWEPEILCGSSRNRSSSFGPKERRGRLRLWWGRMSHPLSWRSPHMILDQP